MKICFLGYDDLPVLAPEYSSHGAGGEQVQHTLLARALARRGHEVSMVVHDYGQADGNKWEGITTFKAFKPDAGIPVFRYVHPRWTGAWDALKRADADVYYASCAGMHLGLLALFCERYGRRFVFRIAHDRDCEPDQLLIKYWRDRKLYEYGLRRAHGILAQTASQQAKLMKNYRLNSSVAGMLVAAPQPAKTRDIDVLWVNNIRQFKRPDLYLALARLLPHRRFHMVGGPQPGFETMFAEVQEAARAIPNFEFHGPVPFNEVGSFYARARVFVNTSDSEGFPNSYLQAWSCGTPVVAFFDPDQLIRNECLGKRTESLEHMASVVSELLSDPELWGSLSSRCVQYMQLVHDEDRILAPYLEAFREAQSCVPARSAYS